MIVRKAYRKKALQTHPDRLPRDIPLAEKEAAEERFRQVHSRQPDIYVVNICS